MSFIADKKREHEKAAERALGMLDESENKENHH